MTNKNIYRSLGGLDLELIAKAAPADKVQKTAAPLGAAVSDCQRTRFFKTNVGASIARPPKNRVFWIFLKGNSPVFLLAATDFALQNLRTTDGRPYEWLF